MLGPLVIVGGAEDKLRSRRILRETVRLAGGPAARIAVVPTASSLGPAVSEVYDALFRTEGAADVVTVDPASRDEARDPDLAASLDDVTGVFMTGGNQLKLSALVSGTPVEAAIKRARARGAVIAGTSAGASIQSSHMVAFGGPGATPKQRMTQVAAGFGLLEQCCVDQHFEQRNRYGRLLMIVAESPQLIGMGVDEDTAAVVERGGDGTDPALAEHDVLRVVGRGAVTLMDPARMVTNAYEAKRAAPLLASGVQLHVLPHGARFDLTTRTLLPWTPAVDPEDEAELTEAGRDLRRMARDIAAGDVSPSVLRRRLDRRRRRTPRPPGPAESDSTA
ncbi:MAG: cyanophycinase [Nocardioides sp.]|nr:cyanophycinase [Nocardioides sp.]